jgi:hypothetical protein
MEMELPMWIERDIPVLFFHVFPQGGGIDECVRAHRNFPSKAGKMLPVMMQLPMDPLAQRQGRALPALKNCEILPSLA